MTPSADLLDHTIASLAVAYRAGSVSPVEATAAALRRIEQTQRRLRAFVVIDRDGAMDAASIAERELREGRDRGPLHGIPVAVKDIFDVAGWPTRCGSASRADAEAAERDAVAVARLRAAGVVVVGKTVTQEFAAGVLSPPARNPWDPDRAPGGSSGGSAVAVAVGAALIGLGSDTGGSVRIPAAACGVVGFKPAFGALPVDGVFPLAWSLDTVGPLTRSVDDAALAYAALRGESPPAAGSPESIAGLRLALPREHFLARLQPDVAETVHAAASVFRSLGADVVEVDWPSAGAARDCAFVLNRVETAAVHAELAVNAERIAALNPDLRLRIRAGGRLAVNDYLLALRARSVLRDSVADLFRRHRLRAVLAPTLPTTALPAADPVARWVDGDESAGTAWTRLTMPFNATGQPVLALPCGFDSTGLPIGLQLAGRPGDEATLFRLGRAYEAASPWSSKRPPTVP